MVALRAVRGDERPGYRPLQGVRFGAALATDSPRIVASRRSSVSVALLPSGRWRSRVWHVDLGAEVSSSRALGLPPQTYETREEAERYTRMATDLLASRLGRRLRPPVPREIRHWCLAAKGEVNCRHCERPATHLHHVVPRAMCPAGAKNVHENGIPLCSGCHRQWHSRIIEIPHTVLSDVEFRFAVKQAGAGWLERHYFSPSVSAEDRWRHIRGRHARSAETRHACVARTMTIEPRR